MKKLAKELERELKFFMIKNKLSRHEMAEIVERIKIPLATINIRKEFILVVNYGKSIEEAIKDGFYDNVSVSSEDIPVCRTPGKEGEKKVVGKFFRFSSCMIGVEERIKKMKSQGFMPADLLELLALGATYPGLQLKYDIIALGQKISLERYKGKYFINLSHAGDERKVSASNSCFGIYDQNELFLGIKLLSE